MSRVQVPLLAAAFALLALPCSAQTLGGASSDRQAPGVTNRATLPNGRTWERIQLQYVDATYVASILAGRPLGYGGGYGGGYLSPAGGGYGMGGYGMGGYGGGFAGNRFGSPYGSRGGTGGFGGPAGGGFAGTGGFGGGGGFGGAGGFQNGGRGGLFPNLIIIADPSSNSLLVDP